MAAATAGLDVASFTFVTLASIWTGGHDARRWWTMSRLVLGTLATVVGGITLLARAGGAFTG